MSEQEVKDAAVAEAEGMYNAKKQAYRNTQQLFANAMKALQLWKEKHQDLAVDPLHPDLLLLKNKLNKANNWLNDAERRLMDATPTNKQKTSVPYWSEWYAVAKGLNLEEQVGNRLNVPKLFFSTKFNNGLFIRQEYSDVFNMIKTKLASVSSCDSVLVLGSPGIGKSVFGVLMFLLAIKSERNVAYHPLNEDTYYFTNNGSSYDISKDPKDTDTFKSYECYYDGEANDEDAMKYYLFKCVFLFSIPRSKKFNDFVKEDCFKIYMNPWSKEECMTFAKCIPLDNEVWLPKFDHVGGKPRYIFSSFYSDDELSALVRKHTPHNLLELKQQVLLLDQKSACSENMKHIVYIMYRDSRNPGLYRFEFSSEVVEKIVNHRFASESVNEIREWLKTPSTDLQSWRGQLVEKFLLQDLANSNNDGKEDQKRKIRMDLKQYVGEINQMEKRSKKRKRKATR